MRLLLPLLVLISATPAALSAAPLAGSEPTAGGTMVADTALVRKLLIQGAAALRAEQWAEAISLFSSAYEQAEGERRSDANFLWAYALYTQGASIARNSDGDPSDLNRALHFLNDAMARLELHDHRNRFALQEACTREIRAQELALHGDP